MDDSSFATMNSETRNPFDFMERLFKEKPSEAHSLGRPLLDEFMNA
jgi:hypothetical protein